MIHLIVFIRNKIYLPLLYIAANIYVLLHTLEPVMIRTHLTVAEHQALCCIFLNSCGSAWMDHYGQCWKKSSKQRRAQGIQRASAVNQNPRKEVESESKGISEHFANGYVGCWGKKKLWSQKKLLLCWSGCEMPRRNDLLKKVQLPVCF